MVMSAKAINIQKDMLPIVYGAAVVTGVIILYSFYKASKAAGAVIGAAGDVITTATDSVVAGGKSAELDKATNAAATSASSPFNSSYMINNKGRKGVMYLTGAAKKDIAKKIYNEFSPDIAGQYVFAPHMDRLYKYLSPVKTKNQLSDLAYFFEQTYKVPLLKFLQSGLKNAGWTNLDYSTKMSRLLDYPNTLKTD